MYSSKCVNKQHSSFAIVIPTSFLCQEFPERLLLTYKPEEEPLPEDTKPSVEVEPEEPNSVPPSSTEEVAAAPPSNLDTGDLLVSPFLRGLWYLSAVHKDCGICRRYIIACFTLHCAMIYTLFNVVQGLGAVAPDASAIEESNALALAIVPTSKLYRSSISLF